MNDITADGINYALCDIKDHLKRIEKHQDRLTDHALLPSTWLKPTIFYSPLSNWFAILPDDDGQGLIAGLLGTGNSPKAAIDNFNAKYYNEETK